jgi:predicted RNase H-like HicB family nuclease
MAQVIYTVEVLRENDAWIADVVDLPGAHTFARNLTSLDEAVHEVIALVADLPEDAGRPVVRYVYGGVDETFLEAARLGDEREHLETRQRELHVAAALTVSKLASAGYSVRDIGGALRMSPGRVSQIMTSNAKAG